MMSTSGNMLHQTNQANETHIDRTKQNLNTTIETSTDQQRSINRNVAKRTKENDDSFEQEHHVVNIKNQYFSSTATRTTQQQQNPTTSRFEKKHEKNNSSRPTFPPFRISFIADESPSELSIIKDLNKHFRIGLSYGRYSSAGENKTFLLYVNTNEQFDRLMNKQIWPIQICTLDYTITSPSKVPSSYSVVAIGVPVQWKLTEFEIDIKKLYPTIIKVERLYVKGGQPISKVRIDFSSNQEVKKIVENKRLLLDDENTSFAIQPYTPPVRILRCFNCQQYNDHISANCPHKDKPTCFRCGQNHPYNPNCLNKICCANCHQEHMAGSPKCLVKIEERRKYKQQTDNTPSINSNNYNGSTQAKTIEVAGAWTANATRQYTPAQASTPVQKIKTKDCSDILTDIGEKLDQIMKRIEQLTNEQVKMNEKITNAFQQIEACQKNVDALKEFIMDRVCPFICNLGYAFLGKNKQNEQDKIFPILVNFKQQCELANKVHADKQNDNQNDKETINMIIE
ncbi:hypothetical protein I4U23_022553 [Adineta vaga]|nr:hypothetical protein I4U23_022553 [Adineta vaga]